MNWQNSPPFGRRPTLIPTLDRLETKSSEAQLIVEIGTTERFLPDALGVAILAFGWYAVQRGNTRIVSADIREGAIAHSGEIVQQYLPEALHLTTYHVGDAYDLIPAVLENRPVDLCYMDMNFEIHCDPEFENYAKRNQVPSNYVQLFERFPEWRSGALVLIDDTTTQPPYRDKGLKLIPHMLERGWRLLTLPAGYPQALLEKI